MAQEDIDTTIKRMGDPDMPLLECPFCGEKEAFRVYSVGWEQPGRAVGCDMCGAFGPKADTKEEAQLEWNDRYKDNEIKPYKAIVPENNFANTQSKYEDGSAKYQNSVLGSDRAENNKVMRMLLEETRKEAESNS